MTIKNLSRDNTKTLIIFHTTSSQQLQLREIHYNYF